MRERIVHGMLKKYANNSQHAILYFMFQGVITLFALLRIAQKVAKQTVMEIFIVLMLNSAQLSALKKLQYFLAQEKKRVYLFAFGILQKIFATQYLIVDSLRVAFHVLLK